MDAYEVDWKERTSRLLAGLCVHLLLSRDDTRTVWGTAGMGSGGQRFPGEDAGQQPEGQAGVLERQEGERDSRGGTAHSRRWKSKST